LKTNLRARLLTAWMAWALPRPYLILGVAFALAVASVIYTAARLDLQTSQLDLISPQNPLLRLTQRLKPFDARDSLTVVIEAPTPARAVAFLNRLADRLHEDPAHYKDVFYRVDPQTVRPWALLYLKTREIHEIRDRMEDYPDLIRGLVSQPDLLQFLTLVNQEMASRMVEALFTDFLKTDKTPTEKDPQRKPMDLGFLIRTLEGMSSYLNGSAAYRSPWSAFFKEGAWEREIEGYFWMADKKFLLMFVTPRREKNTFNRVQASLAHLRGVIREVQGSFSDVQVGVTGQDALKTDEMTVALEDISWATWLSFAGVWILMILFFRSEGRTFIRMVSLVVGMCWTFGWATWFVGHLNILSMVFAPMLVGIGVDYGIHWFSRMEEEERDPSLSREEVIRRVAAGSGPGILLAGVSAALSFLPFILTGFKGLVELGLITGVGILLNLVADFSVLPMLSLLSKGPRRKRSDAGTDPGKDLVRLDRRRASWVLAGAAVVTVLSLWLGSGVRFDLNPLHLQAKGTESVVWEENLRRNSKRSVLLASTTASSLEELEEKSEALRQLPTVWRVQNVLTLLPEDQDAKIEWLRSAGADLPELPAAAPNGPTLDAERVADVLERIRFKMDDAEAERWGARRPMVEQIAAVRETAGRIIDALRGSPQAVRPLLDFQTRFQEDLIDAFDLIQRAGRAHPMTIQDLPKPVLDRFLRDGTYLIRIFPAEDIWEPEPRDRFVRELRSVDPEVAGDAVTLHEFTDDFRRASIQAAIYAAIGNFLLLAVLFRGWLLPVVALVPVFAAILWITGAMTLVGIHFNLANSIYLPLIVAAGAEYGIIVLHRWREGTMEPGHLPQSTAKGVILAELTTTAGFGSLMICRHQGIFSLGLLAFAGSICVLGAAVFLLPAILARMTRPKPTSQTEG
jgi:hopanoid biosynthesis associated RND transporter like protein HpnN